MVMREGISSTNKKYMVGLCVNDCVAIGIWWDTILIMSELSTVGKKGE